MTVDLNAIRASIGTGEAVRSLVTSNRTIGSFVLNVDSINNYPPFFIATTGTLDTNGRLTAATMQVFKGHTSGSTLVIDNFAPGYTDKGNSVADVVVIKPATYWADTIADDILGLANGSAVQSSAVLNVASVTTQNLTVANASSNAGWYPLSPLPTISSIIANGNRNYTINTTTDETGTLSPGMRLRTTRTVAAPTQSTLLNGTTQYYNRTATINGMTFTNNFVVSAWIKPTAYAFSMIASRSNGTNGWQLNMQVSGQIQLIAFNGSSSNYSYIQSTQSVPLNRWTHVTLQLDMASFTNTPTTSYVMFDCVDIPATVFRAGTNPTSLVQAGNLEVGSTNGGTYPFPGKIAQLAIYGAKVTEAAIRATISQSLVGTETSLISAYSFNNSLNDLNTTNANNLTANGSVVATNADSPFGTQDGGAISSTVDYAIIHAVTPTAITVQVPEGCAIPTTGGVSAISYSSVNSPYGFLTNKDAWTIKSLWTSSLAQSSPTNAVWYNVGGIQQSVPLGAWVLSLQSAFTGTKGSASNNRFFVALTTNPTSALDPELTAWGGGDTTTATIPMFIKRTINLTATTSYYCSMMTLAACTGLYFDANNNAMGIIAAENAYL